MPASQLQQTDGHGQPILEREYASAAVALFHSFNLQARLPRSRLPPSRAVRPIGLHHIHRRLLASLRVQHLHNHPRHPHPPPHLSPDQVLYEATQLLGVLVTVEPLEEAVLSQLVALLQALPPLCPLLPPLTLCYRPLPFATAPCPLLPPLALATPPLALATPPPHPRDSP